MLEDGLSVKVKCSLFAHSNRISAQICRLELAWEAEGPFYWATLSLLVQSPERWGQTRLRHLTRLLVTAHVRSMSPTPLSAVPVSDVSVRPFPIYRSALLFFALIDAIYNNHFKVSVAVHL